MSLLQGYDPVKVKEALQNDDFEDRERFKTPGEYLVRLITVPYREEVIFYPALVHDEDTNSIEPAWRAVRVDPRRQGILDQLAVFERNLRQARGQKAESQFDRSKKWVFAGFNRADEEPVVRIFELNWTCMQRLEELAQLADLKDSTKLRHGPYFAWDAVITKKVDPSKSPRYGTSWSLDVYEAPFQSKIPISVHQKGISADDMESFFSDEELAAIKESSVDLAKETAALSDEEILEVLAKAPINLGFERNGTPVFQDKDSLAQKIEEIGLSQLPASERPALPANESPSISPEMDSKAEAAIPTESEVVEEPAAEEPVEEPAKTKVKKEESEVEEPAAEVVEEPAAEEKPKARKRRPSWTES